MTKSKRTFFMCPDGSVREIPPGKKLLFYDDGVAIVGPADPEERKRKIAYVLYDKIAYVLYDKIAYVLYDKIAYVLYELARPRIEAILSGESEEPKDDDARESEV